VCGGGRRGLVSFLLLQQSIGDEQLKRTKGGSVYFGLEISVQALSPFWAYDDAVHNGKNLWQRNASYLVAARREREGERERE
jgi:hypothetical protein